MLQYVSRKNDGKTTCISVETTLKWVKRQLKRHDSEQLRSQLFGFIWNCEDHFTVFSLLPIHRVETCACWPLRRLFIGKYDNSQSKWFYKRRITRSRTSFRYESLRFIIVGSFGKSNFRLQNPHFNALLVPSMGSYLSYDFFFVTLPWFVLLVTCRCNKYSGVSLI